MMKRWTGLLLAILLLGFPVSGRADTKSDPWAPLTDIANQIYQSIDQGRNETAGGFLKTFEKKWNALKDKDDKLPGESVRALTASEEKLKIALKNATEQDPIKEAATEFRLAVDAMTSREHPLWIGMKDRVLAQYSKVQKDVAQGNDAAFQHDLNQFSDLYQMIYPSLVIDIASAKITKVDAEINYLLNHRMTIVQDKNRELSHLKALATDLNSLFQKDTQKLSTPLIKIGVVIGGFIMATLMLSAWRKYEGERARKGDTK